MIRPRQFFLAALLSLSWVASVAGQTCKLPAEVRIPAGNFGIVAAETDCAELQWYVIDPGLSMIPPNLLKDSKTAVVMAPTGRYRLLAYGAKGDKPTPIAVCMVIVGDAPTPVPPGPTPPGPTPPDPPGPVPPAPIPGDGLRFIIIYETADLPKMSKGQLDAMYSPVRAGAVRDYALAKCPKGGRGANTPEFRIWDKDVNAAGDTQVWQDALKRPRSAVPWIIVSNGKTGYEGPMPASADEMLKLLQKYGG